MLNSNGSLISDTLGVCNAINDFFTNVAQTLANKLPSPSNLYNVTSAKFKSFYQGIVAPGEFSLKEVDINFIYEELSNLDIINQSGLMALHQDF